MGKVWISEEDFGNEGTEFIAVSSSLIVAQKRCVDYMNGSRAPGRHKAEDSSFKWTPRGEGVYIGQSSDSLYRRFRVYEEDVHDD